MHRLLGNVGSCRNCSCGLLLPFLVDDIYCIGLIHHREFHVSVVFRIVGVLYSLFHQGLVDLVALILAKSWCLHLIIESLGGSNIAIESKWANFALFLLVSLSHTKFCSNLMESSRVHIASLRVLILRYLPACPSPSICLCCLQSTVLHTGSAKHGRTPRGLMSSKLSFIRDTSWILPLFLINAFPHWVCVQICVKALSQRNAATFVYRFL